MRLLGLTVVAFVVGSALFAVLNHFAPFPLETGSQAQATRIRLLANGGSAAVGALVVVLVSGRWWGIPLAGGLVFAVMFSAFDPRFSLTDAVGVASLNFVQFLVPALVGAVLAWGAFTLASRLHRRHRQPN